MPDTTQTTDTTASPGHGWCAWHKAISPGVRLIQAFDAGSGGGTTSDLFACAPCRDAFHLVPLADQP